MKQIIDCYHNWRIDVLIFIAMVILILVTSEAPTPKAFAIQITAVLLFTFCGVGLFRVWKSHGKLPELDKITEE